jgi:hypothetical protein
MSLNKFFTLTFLYLLARFLSYEFALHYDNNETLTHTTLSLYLFLDKPPYKHSVLFFMTVFTQQHILEGAFRIQSNFLIFLDLPNVTL